MNLDWIAGFFDGEGSVSLQFHRMPSCKYGYQFLPCISISQKTRNILECIQKQLQMGRLYTNGEQWRLEIRRQQNLRQFVTLFSSRTQMKRQQLLLLIEALGLLHQGPMRGAELWGGALPKSNVLRLLEIVVAIRELNGIRGKRTNDIGKIREYVINFDEESYQKRIRISWKKRIAPLIERAARRRDLKLSPDTIRSLYWEKGFSAEEVARYFDCDKRTILRQMKRHSIPRRDKDEARRAHFGLAEVVA